MSKKWGPLQATQRIGSDTTGNSRRAIGGKLASCPSAPASDSAAGPDPGLTSDEQLLLVSADDIGQFGLTMRMQMRRLTRLTNAFSKKWENLWAALCLHFAWYNFRVHKSLRVTPAMEAGITDRVWAVQELLA